MTKLHNVLAASVAAVFCFVALPSIASAEVTVLGWPGGSEETALRASVDAYNALSGTASDDKVQLLFFNRDGFYDKLQADLAAGSDAFDINLIATYSIGRYAPFMEPVDLGADAEKVFGKTVLETMQFEGKQYGVPTDLSLHFMYYRKDLTDALMKDDAAKKTYGDIAQKYLGKSLQPKDPDSWTWDDWAATALYFTKSVNPSSPVKYGTVLQMKNLLFNMMVFQSLPRSYGADWTDESGKVTVDSQAYRAGLELYKKLYDAGATPKDSLSYEYPETNAAWESGQVATALQWNAAASELTSTDKDPAVAEDTAIVAPPAGPDGRKDHIHGLGLGLNKSSMHKEGATKFLKWLATEDAALTYAKAGGSPGLSPSSVEKIAKDRPDLVQLGQFAGSYGYVMRGATSAKALSVYEAQAKEFTAYWAGQKTLDAALSATTQSMTELLK
ncbi:extracellular solute-binding protein [Rhizobium sp. VS19-DR104.2]|uniref:extracellular solute-binding protein n=1 Tax=unclassified Rhizobium TaxID=2613769 RepID=UPI001C5B08E8|nr:MULTISPECIES: extracellular solute-binding protein [unclassified Rhizobium]MBZ5762381.1 extracellular solute-binding protein [Rhizobium sp. VS19-DR96]MBZ5769133.1 extracellular solute-binding protein [Rhizobium sp. VS19-DR129.2]MBZ5775961.1 extracellular solute-binding protein [Rhizobium sp. VS19-DRK62.2]MBZ5786275.1 extracellular solute-binding protein [Rhizobium sp. VS19-DR121]MBZ5804269.1 extracellular solute-binding protein [Rhizobium sp. VS19-DR181]